MKIFEHIKNIQTDIFSIPVIGVDISDASLHFAKAKPIFGTLPAIEFFGTEKIPNGLIEAGEIKKEKELSDLIRLVFGRLQGGPHYIVGALPEEKAFIKALQIPALENKTELQNAIRFEIETSIPLSASEMYFDYEDITAKNKIYDHRDINVIAYPKTLIDSYVRVFKNAQIRIMALELESQGIMRSLINPTDTASALIIDIGRTKAGFAIYSDRSLIFTATVPVGGDDFEKAIQTALAVNAAEAEKIKIKIGLSKKEMGGKSFKALEPLISVIINEAKKDIDFFEHHSRHTHEKFSTIQKIILCGGDAYLSGLIEMIAEQINLPVELGKPLNFFSNNHAKSGLSEHEALSFATALGAALRYIR